MRRLLLDTKYDVNIRDSLGKNSIAHCISFRNIEIATVLISFKVTDINLEDSGGMTPCHLAIQIGCSDLIKLLLEKSALTKDLVVNEWREVYGKQAPDTMMLTKRESRERFVCFIPEEGQISSRFD